MALTLMYSNNTVSMLSFVAGTVGSDFRVNDVWHQLRDSYTIQQLVHYLFTGNLNHQSKYSIYILYVFKINCLLLPCCAVPVKWRTVAPCVDSTSPPADTQGHSTVCRESLFPPAVIKICTHVCLAHGMAGLQLGSCTMSYVNKMYSIFLMKPTQSEVGLCNTTNIIFGYYYKFFNTMTL